MPDDKTPNGDGVSPEDDKQDDNNVTVDRAELEGLREKAKRIETLDGYAKEANMDDAEAYFSTLEDHVFNQQNKSDDKPTEPDTTNKAVTPKAEENNPPITGLTKEQELTISQATHAANNALLQVQFADYEREQFRLPEKDRSPAKKSDLMKSITGAESGVIVGLARNKYDGNVFKAANYVHLLNEGISIARKEGADSEAAKINAAASAAAPANSGRIPTPGEAPTPEEKALAENKKLADEIAPNHAADYVMPN